MCKPAFDAGTPARNAPQQGQPASLVAPSVRARLSTAQSPPGLDFTARMRSLCEHVVESLGEFRHVDLNRVAVSFAQARKPVIHGMQASLTPLRFEGGATVGTVRGRRYTVQPVYDQAGTEMLYVLTFYLPRFMQLEFREKLVTVLHELWHIGPEFDGDLRRHAGRCYAHSHSQAAYDQQMGRFVDAWLATDPPAALYDFLRLDFIQVRRRYGRVYGLKLPRPKLIPG